MLSGILSRVCLYSFDPDLSNHLMKGRRPLELNFSSIFRCDRDDLEAGVLRLDHTAYYSVLREVEGWHNHEILPVHLFVSKSLEDHPFFFALSILFLIVLPVVYDGGNCSEKTDLGT